MWGHVYASCRVQVDTCTCGFERVSNNTHVFVQVCMQVYIAIVLAFHLVYFKSCDDNAMHCTITVFVPSNAAMCMHVVFACAAYVYAVWIGRICTLVSALARDSPCAYPRSCA